MNRYKIGILLIGLVFLSCSELDTKNPLSFIKYKLSYERDIKPIFSNQCISCHSGNNPAGNYDLSSILKIMSNGTDHIPNVIIGNPYSLLLLKINIGDVQHREWIGSEENAKKLYEWIVEDSLIISEPIVHLAGPMNVNSPNFHGQDIRKKAWSLESCKLCHGADYSGGSSGKSCNNCHYPNPEECNLCHGGLDNKTGAPPLDLNDNTNMSFRGVGAHTIHLTNSKISNGINCESCHIVPKALLDPGHVFSEAPAEVIFSDLALTLGANPAWDTLSLTCKNVYCHGNFPSGNRTNAPSWTNFKVNSECSPSCHELPPEGETRNGYKHFSKVPQCWYCHLSVIDENNNFFDKSTHINGKVER